VSVQEIAILNEALENAEAEIKRLRGGIGAIINGEPRVDNDGVAHMVPWRLRLSMLLAGRENDLRCRP